MKFSKLHARARQVAKNYLACEYELIDILQELDRTKDFSQCNASSLREYCIDYLQLACERAEDLIRVARKAREVPELKIALKSGNITLTNARMLSPILTQENSAGWLAKAKESKRALERELKNAFPEKIRAESLRYVGEDRLELRIEISEAEAQKLARAADVLTQKRKRLVTRKEVIAAALELFLEREDPLRRAQRILTRSLKKVVPDRRGAAAFSNENKPLGQAASKELARQVDANRGASKESGASKVAAQESNANKAAAQQGSVNKAAALKAAAQQDSGVSKAAAEVSTNKGAGQQSDANKEAIPKSSASKAASPKNRANNNLALSKHQVMLRDQGQCTHVHQNGKRCTNQKFLDTHHVRPKELGGSDEARNLTTLCTLHHRRVHSELQSQFQRE